MRDDLDRELRKLQSSLHRLYGEPKWQPTYTRGFVAGAVFGVVITGLSALFVYAFVCTGAYALLCTGSPP